MVLILCASCSRYSEFQYAPAVQNNSALFVKPGYKETLFRDGRYYIEVWGYPKTKEELYVYYLHKRSAELCELGYRYVQDSLRPLVSLTSGGILKEKVNSTWSWSIFCITP